MNKQEERRGKHLIGEVRRTEVPYGCLAVWFLGQESVIIKGDGVTVYIDPYVSPNPDRTFPAPISPEDITNADVCLITHDHEDHLDKGTLPQLVIHNPAVMITAPAMCEPLLKELGVKDEQFLKAEEGKWISYGPKLRVLPLAAAHEQLTRDEQGNPHFVGYILELNGVTLYHAGDTVLYPELVDAVSSHPIDLAMLPINGRDYFRNARNLVGNMSYREAAEFAAVAQFETVIPLHYDLFAGNAENPGYFVDYLYKYFPEQKFHVMARAERFVYISARAFLDKE
ncbi:MBL fold metallo-hydrolase [Paenibacillus wynnii]|uniref:MBL fold metallo-hydrolase n=1 Tax=Paenibacillus wynnii TaxID=268407 RepID=UPI00278D3626|nr:MBL fold metallo-hydrolase [Paenibacillus wynnii]MDQ0195716.1 L-ascorbate metabolism protein UlaG (beta-lactamase superfamily) [Paenibacillus wynnii]